jgi:hypothetical protein
MLLNKGNERKHRREDISRTSTGIALAGLIGEREKASGV